MADATMTVNVVALDLPEVKAIVGLLREALDLNHPGYAHSESVRCPLCDWQKKASAAL